MYVINPIATGTSEHLHACCEYNLSDNQIWYKASCLFSGGWWFNLVWMLCVSWRSCPETFRVNFNDIWWATLLLILESSCNYYTTVLLRHLKTSILWAAFWYAKKVCKLSFIWSKLRVQRSCLISLEMFLSISVLFLLFTCINPVILL